LEKKQSPFKIIGELALFSLIIGIINIFFPDNPGFLKSAFNPYVLLSFIVAAYYGKYYGFLSILSSATIVSLVYPVIMRLFLEGKSLSDFWMTVDNESIIPISTSLIGIYIFGLIRDAHVSRAERDRSRLKAIAVDKGVLKKEVRALRIVNAELERRVEGQEDSITTIYTRMQELQSLNLQRALELILETVQYFTAASKCSIWKHLPEEKRLEVVETIGWDEGMKVSTTLPDTDTIEGWVVRNNTIFSAKMLLQYENLRDMDKGRNLFTAPLFAGRKIWGIVNIEEMPFEKYNLYTERMLQLIISLSSTALEKAVEYEKVVKQEETNPITKLPSFINFSHVLENAIEKMRYEKGTLSVVIAEVRNFDMLVDQFDRKSVLELFVRLVDYMREISHGLGRFFHYKEENQIVMLYPNVDFDGASLFSLDVLSKLNDIDWNINGNSVSVDLILGYSSLTEATKNPEEILEVAENLLEMQKI